MDDTQHLDVMHHILECRWLSFYQQSVGCGALVAIPGVALTFHLVRSPISAANIEKQTKWFLSPQPVAMPIRVLGWASNGVRFPNQSLGGKFTGQNFH